MARSRAWRHVLDDCFVERDQPHRIVLTDSKKCQRRSEVLRVLKLCYFAAPIAHRSTRVDEQVYSRVRIALILFYVETVCSSEQFPIQMAQVIAGHVLAMLGEVR